MLAMFYDFSQKHEEKRDIKAYQQSFRRMNNNSFPAKKMTDRVLTESYLVLFFVEEVNNLVILLLEKGLIDYR